MSSVATRYQLGLLFHAGSLIVAPRASTPHGIWESAMNAASSGSTSAANEATNFERSRNRKPSCGGRIGGTGAPGAGFAISDETDSPRSGAKAAIYLLCLLASAGCAALLIRSYLQTGARLLLWSAGCFTLLALNNFLVVVDLLLIESIDFLAVRRLTALAAVSVLIVGFIWETEES